MAIRQLSVFIENKKGKLSDAVKTISEAGINMRAMSIGDSDDFGILRLIVSDTAKAYTGATGRDFDATAGCLFTEKFRVILRS